MLHSVVGDHPTEFRRSDELEFNGHVDDLRQQLFHPFFTQQLAELDQGGGVSGLAVFVIGAAREELPARGIGPAGYPTLVGLVVGVLEIQQGDHDAHGYARATGIALATRHGGRLAKQIQVGHSQPIAGFAHKEVRQRGFDLLPRHARGQNSQWVAQVDHLVDTAAKEVISGGAGKHGRNSQKIARNGY